MDQGYLYEPRVLRVDLATGAITQEKKEAGWARKYLGGMGFGTRILWEELPPETAWNAPENELVFPWGPLPAPLPAAPASAASTPSGC